jgi:polyhydroxybutyrate depolymerase
MRLILVCLALALLLTGCRNRRDGGDATPTGTPAPSSQAIVSPELTASPAAPTTAPETAAPPVSNASPGCGQPHAVGESEASFEAEGLTRAYRLFVPASYSPGTATALVLNFHGYRSNAREQETYSRMPEEAEAQGFITVAPEGTGQPQEWWLAGERLPGYVDDFSFTRQLVERLKGELCIDPDRVYATGISNGAAFASLAACKLNDIIAAVAPVAAEPYSDIYCEGKDPVPIIAFHGTDDELVPFEGGNSPRGLPVNPARENMSGWAAFNGCDPALQTERIASDVVLESYGDCDGGADVQLYVIEGGGHTWPGSHDIPIFGETTHSIDATELMWQFFAAHPHR